MPFCDKCGEIIRAGAACALCGGSAKDAVASGFGEGVKDNSASPSMSRVLGQTATFQGGELAAAKRGSVSSNTSSLLSKPPLASPGIAARPAALDLDLKASSSSKEPPQQAEPTKSPPLPRNPKPAVLIGSVGTIQEPSREREAAIAPERMPVTGIGQHQPTSSGKGEKPLRCKMCYVQLDPDKAKSSREAPDDVYCLSCWNVRPVPEKELYSVGAMPKAILERQIGNQLTNKQNICAACNKPLQVGSVVTALDKSYHEACFVCDKCRKPLGDSFVNKQGKPWCRECHGAELQTKARSTVSSEAMAPVTLPGFNIPRDFCSACSKSITTSMITLNSGDKYCTDCWVCFRCSRPIESTQYTMENGRPIHPDCATRDRCAKCGLFIDGPFVMQGSSKLHSRCFTCSVCQSELAGKPFSKVNGKEACSNCVKRGL